MNDIDVLVLHGSPGSGKSTLAQVIAELLREADLAHAVIDLDEISLVHPHPGRSFARENLKALWPNYAAVPGVRLLLPSVLADEEERALLHAAVPGTNLAVCELTAPREVLLERVTAREPTEFLKQNLRRWVEIYHAREDLERIRDFSVSTHDRSEQDAAREVLAKVGWPVG